MSLHPIHHITAIASDPAQCVHFYTKILGLRLVKKSVNQDQTEAYHLFFGDKTGEPGMDLTFFTFPGARQGTPGPGSVTTISLAVPTDSLGFWKKRFEQFEVTHSSISEKYDHQVLEFEDNDGQPLALVALNQAETAAIDTSHVWTTDDVPFEHAIRSFYSATLATFEKDRIAPLLTHILGFSERDEQQQHTLFALENKPRGGHLEIAELPDQEPVIPGTGTVHHIAFAVENETALEAKRQQLIQIGLYPTEVINRHYFKSVYFRTPAGILFELATNGPGFTIDEDEATLGEKLSLPPFLEDQRQAIEKKLVPFD